MISRRRFLVAFGSALVGVTLSASQLEKALAAFQSTEKGKNVQWGMIVDLRKCDPLNCRDCIDACVREHNIPKIEGKDHIWWITFIKFENAFPEQTHEMLGEFKEIPTLILCNHCRYPPCTKVCPTQATWQREDGIVMMDWHRCIGCRYCMAACPYGSRSFNWRDPRLNLAEITNPMFPTRTKGVVEKCILCYHRIDRGELPACVEACKNNALIFGDLNKFDSEIRKMLDKEFTIRRKPSTGAEPKIYYILPWGEE
ncbi:4Fe-4S ferredoxin [Archaeoglobales archaeon]|nr:MAG: 4Fe-4S ferredoxin [Archaeoglobales archaeon]